MAVITISRQFGAGGNKLAEALAKELDIMLVDRHTISEALLALNLPPDILQRENKQKSREDLEKRRRFLLTAIHDYLFDLAGKHSILLLGQGGQYLFEGRQDALHLLIHAPLEVRIQRIQKIRRLERKQAERMVKDQDRQRRLFLKQFFKKQWLTAEAYDLCLNTAKLGLDATTRLVMETAKEFLADTEKAANEQERPQTPATPRARFMHASEQEFANILDFYNIRWEYEPRTFPLSRDENGKVTEAFAPDFYLPDHDLYVELTTQRQKLVWRKNKKARRLRELYPGIKVKIIYNRDFKHLLESFGVVTEK